MNIVDFNSCEDSKILYGGHAGDKDGIIYNGENWMLKYPKSTDDLKGNIQISYTTAPLSEYIGSNIYKILGYNAQETLLGEKANKIVVACKDFRNNDEDLFDYNHIKNKHSEEVEKELQEITNSTPSSATTNLSELKVIMNKNPYFVSNEKLKERFWDMFVIDSFIGNNDRNEGNWGLLFNRTTKAMRIVPIYDNGASFFSKSSDNQLLKILNDERLFKDNVYNNSLSAFEDNGKKINPLKYIEKLEDNDLNQAIIRNVPIIKDNLDNIVHFIYSIPNNYKGLDVISNTRKEFYTKCLEYRYEKVLLPSYEKVRNVSINTNRIKIKSNKMIEINYNSLPNKNTNNEPNMGI